MNTTIASQEKFFWKTLWEIYWSKHTVWLSDTIRTKEKKCTKKPLKKVESNFLMQTDFTKGKDYVHPRQCNIIITLQ